MFDPLVHKAKEEHAGVENEVVCELQFCIPIPQEMARGNLEETSC